MNRLSPLLAIAALPALASATGLLAADAQAARGEPVYRVTLTQPLAAPRQEIIKGKIWRCSGDSCIGQQSGSRAELTCKRVASEFGKIASFAGPKGEMGPDELAACNGD